MLKWIIPANTSWKINGNHKISKAYETFLIEASQLPHGADSSQSLFIRWRTWAPEGEGTFLRSEPADLKMAWVFFILPTLQIGWSTWMQEELLSDEGMAKEKEAKVIRDKLHPRVGPHTVPVSQIKYWALILSSFAVWKIYLYSQSDLDRTWS